MTVIQHLFNMLTTVGLTASDAHNVVMECRRVAKSPEALDYPVCHWHPDGPADDAIEEFSKGVSVEEIYAYPNESEVEYYALSYPASSVEGDDGPGPCGKVVLVR